MQHQKMRYISLFNAMQTKNTLKKLLLPKYLPIFREAIFSKHYLEVPTSYLSQALITTSRIKIRINSVTAENDVHFFI